MGIPIKNIFSFDFFILAMSYMYVMNYDSIHHLLLFPVSLPLLLDHSSNWTPYFLLAFSVIAMAMACVEGSCSQCSSHPLALTVFLLHLLPRSLGFGGGDRDIIFTVNTQKTLVM